MDNPTIKDYITMLPFGPARRHDFPVGLHLHSFHSYPPGAGSSLIKYVLWEDQILVFFQRTHFIGEPPGFAILNTANAKTVSSCGVSRKRGTGYEDTLLSRKGSMFYVHQ